MNVGYVFAVLAATASGSGSILESIGVRRAGAFGGTSMELVGLRRQWIYFAGLGVDLTGFVCAVAGAIGVAHFAAIARQRARPQQRDSAGRTPH